MQAGKLRQPICLQRKVPGDSGELETWTTYDEVRAAINPLTGREREFALSFATTVNHKITIRYHSGLKPTDRVFINDDNPQNYRVFAINAALDVENRHREHDLYCTEIIDYEFTAADNVPLPGYDDLTVPGYDQLGE